MIWFRHPKKNIFWQKQVILLTEDLIEVIKLSILSLDKTIATDFLVTLSTWQSHSHELFSRFVKWQSYQIRNYLYFCHVTKAVKRPFYPYFCLTKPLKWPYLSNIMLTKPLKKPWKYLLRLTKIVLTRWYIEYITRNVKIKCEF